MEAAPLTRATRWFKNVLFYDYYSLSQIFVFRTISVEAVTLQSLPLCPLLFSNSQWWSLDKIVTKSASGKFMAAFTIWISGER